VIDDLTAVIKNADASNYELGSAALALGQIGDERAVAALLDIATDTQKRFGEMMRALAVVALGQIGDRRDVPVLSRVSTDVNYRAHVPAITELLTIL
jgi:HEAT repeat protein